jgi:hypothetical protein
MPDDLDWVSPRIAEARKCSTVVSDAVAERIEKLLITELSDRPLSPGKLKTMASILIADMTPASAETETKK